MGSWVGVGFMMWNSQRIYKMLSLKIMYIWLLLAIWLPTRTRWSDPVTEDPTYFGFRTERNYDRTDPNLPLCCLDFMEAEVMMQACGGEMSTVHPSRYNSNLPGKKALLGQYWHDCYGSNLLFSDWIWGLVYRKKRISCPVDLDKCTWLRRSLRVNLPLLFY